VCRGHTSAVLDTAFSPFDDQVVASGGDDGQVCVWNVPLEQVTERLQPAKPKDGVVGSGPAEDIRPVASFQGGRRRVGHVEFHPTANQVLAAATGEPAIRLFDLETQKVRSELGGFKDSIQSMTFDWTGSAMAATCRDRKLRLFDVRAPENVQTVDGHGGIKGARAVWCGDKQRIISTGFSRISERQLFLWDPRQLTKPVRTVAMDSSNGIIMPFWCDNNICFLAGKGDGNIRYYELESDELYYLSEYKSIEPQSGMAFLPRRAVNAHENEIARAFKVTNNMIQPVSFYVPRKSDAFQADIFPPAPAAEPALSATEFFDEKKTVAPHMMDMDTKATHAGGEAEATPVTANAAPEKADEKEPKAKDVAAAKAEESNAKGVKAEEPKAEESKAKESVVEESKAAEEPKGESKEEAKEPKEEPKETKEEPKPDGPGKSEGSASETAPKAETGVATAAAAASAAPANGQPSKAADNDPSGSAAAAEIENLKAQLAERDTRIRELEMETLKYVTSDTLQR